jgi:hypothetical protein
MNPKLLHILQHSLGLDEYGRGTFYRNRFVTGEGSTDHPLCMELVALGYMKRFPAVELFGGSDAASYSIFCTGCGVELHDEYRDDLVRLWNGEKESANVDG